MNRIKLKKIEIQGFRSFGTGRQLIELPPTIAVFWGGNSQGKTSFAEAIEFLLTGQIGRRELLASTKEEFSDSLKNVHIPNTSFVSISAEIICADGRAKILKRTLNEDYKKGSQGCTSIIQIDGHTCQEKDIEEQLGIKLFHPPLSAPVLAQHTLGYIFSAGPNERAAYFRAMLDTQDLENFRTAVAGLLTYIPEPSPKEIELLQAIESIQNLNKIVSAIRKSESQNDVEQNLFKATKIFLDSLSIASQDKLVHQAELIGQELQNRRAKSFPLDMFTRSSFSPWDKTTINLDKSIQNFLTERSKIDAETRRLVELFKTALLLPETTGGHKTIDCPLCGTANALTPDRILAIRNQVKATETYQTAEKNIVQALQTMEANLSSLSNTLNSSLPKFLREKSIVRREKNFTIAGIHNLISDKELIKDWLTQTRHMIRATTNFKRAILTTQKYISSIKNNIDHWNDPATVTHTIERIINAQETYEQKNNDYSQAAHKLSIPLKNAVELSTNTKGWEELVTLSLNPTNLWNALIQKGTYDEKIKDLEKALKEIDSCNGKVADEKFSDMSNEVKKWWNYLRPDEPTFFDAVQRRSTKARRTVDIKVGLSANEDQSNPKFRDAIAVFSQSQLHCLGLSMFLARTVQEKASFIILDDPVLTSDDDFRPNFTSTVIENLINEGIQVIVLTQDHSSWKDIGHRWSHLDDIQFQIVRNDPVLGTEIRNQNDGLATMIAKAQPFIKSHDPEQRKDGAVRIREAIERFGKEVLVKKRRKEGDSMASITDYDGKNFGEFSNLVYVLLAKDPSHPGKLKAAYSYVTPGPHDDTPPPSAQLSIALGDLRKMKKEYLD